MNLVLIAIAVLVAGLSIGCDGDGPRDREVEEIQRVLTDFYSEAYAPDGNIDIAYMLLTEESRASCSRDAFERMAIVGRQSLLQREPTLEIKAQEILDNEAFVEVMVTVGSFTSPLFPANVKLEREDDRWRYAITTDPTCSSAAAFFNLRERPGVVPGHEVTPVSQGNPSCDPSYPFDCIPSPPPVLECADLGIRNFAVWPPDPHGLDLDHDGFGCEE